jgi:hypothetical protein
MIRPLANILKEISANPVWTRQANFFSMTLIPAFEKMISGIFSIVGAAS